MIIDACVQAADSSRANITAENKEIEKLKKDLGNYLALDRVWIHFTFLFHFQTR